ncbi:PepSY domain-containing protein [Algoriphagus limi]|uniref:PepSY domain-containing protein n=1 Tax=Algoriphagus limi TaxID=2975273 RepID=A0ABT2G408_9BACT|nr:PepSY domain-containing protein [Algoriphagus limi]MCS5489201.1 PepSY domain-containing protein [Algoriphagus limi]
MRKNNQYYIRRTHRFLGVFIGIQFFFWTLSGIYFSWTDIDEIHGDHFHETHQMQVSASNLLDPASLDSILQISSLELRYIKHQPFYWINDAQLFDAKTGELKGEISEEEAREIAQIHIKGDFGIKSVEYLTETGSHHEFRERPLPAWAIHFDHPENLTAYIDARNGSFERVRHRSWRWFDFLWMFHTMDYAGRDNFNNLLLRAFSLFGLLTIGSGFTLFFMTIRKQRKKG